MKKQILMIGMILLLANMFLINAEISESMTSILVEVDYNGSVYTFPQYDYFCKEYTASYVGDCTTQKYEDYKQGEIDGSIKQIKEIKKMQDAIANADTEKVQGFNIWTWIVDSIKSLFTRQDKVEQELCKKDSSYSWCKGGTTG